MGLQTVLFSCVCLLFAGGSNAGATQGGKYVGHSGSPVFHGTRSSETGRHLVNLGDVNGDGLDDLAVSSWEWQPEQPDRGTLSIGKIYVLSAEQQTLIAEATGDEIDARLGTDVVAVGDLDGDGSGDFMAAGRGKVRVLSGKTGADLISLDQHPDRFSVIWPVAALGDLDGDGRHDLLVAVKAVAGDMAKMQVLSGRTGELLRTNTVWSLLENVVAVSELPQTSAKSTRTFAVAIAPSRGESEILIVSESGRRIEKRFPAKLSTWSVPTSAGDFDGDGTEDILVGDREDNSKGPDAGVARVYSGENGEVLLEVFGTSEETGNRRDRLGGAVAGGGDLNGDRKPDLLVGATGAVNSSGRVYAFSGGDGQLLATYTGDPEGDLFGTAVAFLGDLNGDGLDDFAASASQGGLQKGGYVMIFRSQVHGR